MVCEGHLDNKEALMKTALSSTATRAVVHPRHVQIIAHILLFVIKRE